MLDCGVRIGREISFARNNLKWFHSCLTHMHSKNICLIVSSYKWQNKHRSVFILPKIKTSYSDIISYEVFCIENYVESYL